MKQIIFIATLFLFVSCGQGSSTKTTKNSTGIDKNNSGQTVTNEQSASITETKIDMDNMPIDVALTFINSYVENCNKMTESIGIVEWVSSNNLTTDHFKTEVETIIENANKEDSELGLDFDPIFAAQDFPDEGFELETFDSKTNLIVVRGKNWADFKLTIKVIFEDNKWLVDCCGIVNITENERSER